jgi:nitrite reductase/ring-hydroxylating ferredoxin subunit
MSSTRSAQDSAAAEGVVVGPAADFPPGSLRMARVDGRRLLVAHASDGLHATDLACPHQGYALTQGELSDDGTLTCCWHNWKYRLSDGACLVGEEDLRMHRVEVRAASVVITVNQADRAEEQARLLASLRSGIAGNRVGQISRDVVRLLRVDADPVQVVWEAVAWGAPRAEFGFGHAMASLVDCLAVAGSVEGDARALPVVQALAGMAEAERRRPLRPAPGPAPDLPAQPGLAFRAAMEAEDLGTAEALLRGALRAGAGPDELRRWLVGTVSDHHLSYGHAAIYVQKAFDLLDLLGWDRADTVLPHLVPAIGYGTREDRLPYMRRFVRALAPLDPAALADVTPEEGWDDGGRLRHALLGRDAEAALTAAVTALRDGAGVEGLLDVVVSVGAHRLTRFDHTVETDPGEDFGWLDLSHVVTYAHAARWAWLAEPGPDTVRLALWTTFLAQYAGRRGYREIPEGSEAGQSPSTPGQPGAPEDSAVPGVPSPEALCRAALGDRAGSLIVTAHLIKTTAAACAEAADRGNPDVLAGAARFVHAPRRERFVDLNVRRAIDLADGRPPR